MISSLAQLKSDPQNRRKHPARNVAMLKEALETVGAGRSIVIDETGEILAGNGVVAAASALGRDKVQVVDVEGDTLVAVRRSGLSPEQKRALAIYDNRTAELAAWDWAQLARDQAAGLTLKPWFTPRELALNSVGSATSLQERFGVPPFSVFDARQGYWQDRKRAWLGLGIQSTIGRAVKGSKRKTGTNSVMNDLSGRLGVGGAEDFNGETVVSIFDPVLCELAYRWFCPLGGLVLDPFAGGSVRGIVAAKLGRRYVGLELSAAQIAANRQQAAAICPARPPVWIHGDARDLAALAPEACDLLFSCPPYGDLECYSDDPRDLSTLEADAFLAAYRAIIGETVRAFEAAGARLYNDAVLVTALASLPLRAGLPFERARKLGKTHQNVLVFCNGDPRLATEAVGAVEYTLTAEL